MKCLKKILALLLALTIVFSLAACGIIRYPDDEKDDEGSSNVDKDDEDDEDDEDTKTDQKEQSKEEDSSNIGNSNKETEPVAPTKPSDEDLLVGTWGGCQFDYKVFMKSVLEAQLGMQGIAPDRSIYMELEFKISEDQIVQVAKIDEASFERYLSAMYDNIFEYLYKAAEAQGMSRAEYDQAFEAANGMTLKEQAKLQQAETMENFRKEMNQESAPMYYRVDAENHRIYVAADKADLESAKEYMEYTLVDGKLTITKTTDKDGQDAGLPAIMKDGGFALPWEFIKK